MLIKKWSVGFCLLFLVFITILVYLPGLKGNFLFDDFSNLGEMNQYGEMSNWDNAKKFVMNGIAGPTGRPISLLTYVPQAGAWLNGEAYPFKVVNLLIHLICGVLLYGATCLILKSYGEIKEQKIQWIALLAAGFWMLHPLMLSTTLYVIQRMAQLPLLFSLLTIIGYLKGRLLINIKPIKAYLLMSISIIFGTILATLSKENGALLPLLILVIEFCNPNKVNKPFWQWRVVFLGLPSIAIVFALLWHIDFSANLWPTRNFNQIERLLTECRVVANYLVQLYIPQIEGYGLFQDGFLVSKSLISPISTLYSFIFLALLLVSAFVLRKNIPLISLAIFFFFAAHLMESTVIGLELYFEHRNYVAGIFIFLPIAIGLYWLSEQIKPQIVILITILIFSFLSFMTYQRAILWSDNIKLMLYWAQNSPNSARAQSVKANVLIKNGQYADAERVLKNAINNMPNNGMLIFQLLELKIKKQSVVESDFLFTINTIKSHRADPQAVIGLRDLMTETVKHPDIVKLYGKHIIKIIDSTLKNSSYRINPAFEKLAYFFKGRIFSVSNDIEGAYQSYLKSLHLSKDVEHGLYMSVLIGNEGDLIHALKLLDETENIYKKQNLKELKKSQYYYDEMIQETRQNMQKDLDIELQKQGASSES
ncbi:hypothetical protein SE27_00745 [Acinetobacter harbinensis]|uniref:hypothetical protein n=1 Tax=Acinetobacter harbinensis TaxID=1353941 RepID=UPI00068E8D83|nr:hypothetical protein [Acinetobacter harbinensis]KWQ03919.1 hypothetical protein SE27_00745 [Acinetobacter harbinensis]